MDRWNGRLPRRGDRRRDRRWVRAAVRLSLPAVRVVNGARRARALAAMADGGVDALILSREANARYVSGARRLWLAGARAFAPGCVLVAATGEVHLLSISDDGVPRDIPVANLYPITWNPVNLFGRLAAIPRLASARPIGVDG